MNAIPFEKIVGKYTWMKRYVFTYYQTSDCCVQEFKVAGQTTYIFQS